MPIVRTQGVASTLPICSIVPIQLVRVVVVVGVVAILAQEAPRATEANRTFFLARISEALWEIRIDIKAEVESEV